MRALIPLRGWLYAVLAGFFIGRAASSFARSVLALSTVSLFLAAVAVGFLSAGVAILGTERDKRTGLGSYVVLTLPLVLGFGGLAAATVLLRGGGALMAALAWVPWPVGAALALPLRAHLPAYIPRFLRARRTKDRQTYA